MSKIDDRFKKAMCSNPKTNAQIEAEFQAKLKREAKEAMDAALSREAARGRHFVSNPASDGKCYVVVEFKDGTYKTTALPDAIGNHLMEQSGRTWSVGQKKQRHSKNAVVDRWLTAKFLRPIRSWDWDASKDQERAGHRQNPSGRTGNNYVKYPTGHVEPKSSCCNAGVNCDDSGKKFWCVKCQSRLRDTFLGRKNPSARCITCGAFKDSRGACQVKKSIGAKEHAKAHPSGGRRNPAKMVKVDEYTGNWQSSLSPTPRLSPGQRVLVSKSPDGREWDDVKRAVPSCYSLEWDRESRGKWDIYRVVLADRRNPSLGMPGMPHTWIAPDGSRVSSGDRIEYFHKSGRVGQNKIAKVLRYLVFDDHVMTDGSHNGDYVDASNFIRVVRRGNQVL